MASVSGTSSMTMSGMTAPFCADGLAAGALASALGGSLAATRFAAGVSAAVAGAVAGASGAVAALAASPEGLFAPEGAVSLFWAKPAQQQATSPNIVNRLSFDFMIFLRSDVNRVFLECLTFRAI